MNLATGNAGEPAAVAEAGDDAARVANCSPQSHFGPAAATRALGVPIKYYASEPTDCTMMPVDDRQGWFFLGVMDYAPFCEDMRRNETAVETVQLGDAAIWVSSRSTLCVQRGGQAIDVEVKEPDKSLAKKKAIDIATKILAAL